MKSDIESENFDSRQAEKIKQYMPPPPSEKIQQYMPPPIEESQGAEHEMLDTKQEHSDSLHKRKRHGEGNRNRRHVENEGDRTRTGASTASEGQSGRRSVDHEDKTAKRPTREPYSARGAREKAASKSPKKPTQEFYQPKRGNAMSPEPKEDTSHPQPEVKLMDARISNEV